jgi:hypothetical protein
MSVAGPAASMLEPGRGDTFIKVTKHADSIF